MAYSQCCGSFRRTAKGLSHTCTKIIFKIQVKSCGKLRFLHLGEKREPLAYEDASLFWACLTGPHSMMAGSLNTPRAEISGADGKDCACSAGDPGSIPGSGRSPGEENGNSL